MRHLRNLVAALLLVGVGHPLASEAKEQPIPVVATLSTFADLMKTIGGARVNVSTIAPATFNPHFIEPKPSDVLKVKRAALLIHAGLDLELWRGPLLDAAGNTKLFPGQPGELDLSQGIALLEVPDHVVSRIEGDIHIYGNPHYWLNPENAKPMAQAIYDKLCALDPASEQDYHRNLQQFLAQLDQKISAWKAKLAPYHGRELVGYHNEWPYLMHFAGLRMGRFLEPKPGIPPTPKQVQFIEGYLRDQRIPAIVQATYFPRQTSDAVAKDTGAAVVLLCQNVKELPACSDYLSMLEYNVTQLVRVLEKGAS